MQNLTIHYIELKIQRIRAFLLLPMSAILFLINWTMHIHILRKSSKVQFTPSWTQPTILFTFKIGDRYTRFRIGERALSLGLVKGTLGLGFVKGTLGSSWLKGTQFRIGQRHTRFRISERHTQFDLIKRHSV